MICKKGWRQVKVKFGDAKDLNKIKAERKKTGHKEEPEDKCSMKPILKCIFIQSG